MESLIDSFFRVVKKLLNFTGGTALSLMMFMTVADVVMRAAGRPILGTYEMVALLLAVVIGFTIPIVSLDRGHVYMEILLERLSKRNRALMNTFSRILCLILFVVIAYNLIMVGKELHASGEVSSTLKIPFYPIAYGVGVVCFIECLVFIFDIVKIWRGQYE
jgi:TRAP-type C4-dicarboxylate transport system permease small subunit